jgi:hypothetical protein
MKVVRSLLVIGGLMWSGHMAPTLRSLREAKTNHHHDLYRK